MTANVGYATLSIIPSFKGALSSMKGELAGPLSQAASDAGDEAQSSFSSKFLGGLKIVAAAGAAILTAGLAGIAGLEKIGSMFDDAGDSIRIQTGKTGQELAGLEDSFENVFKTVPVDAGEASAAIGGLSQKLGLTGKPLEDLSTRILNLSRITGTDLATNVKASADLFNSWGIDVENQGPKLDELFRISQQTGVSVGDLATQMADGGAKFRAAGLSFDETGALLGLLSKNGLDASSVMPALSKAMATAAKDGKPAADVFKETFDSIANAPSDTAAAGIALDIFGAKAGPQFAQLIREGKLGYEEFASTVAAGGDTINAAASDTDDWREKLKLLINKGLLWIEPIATKVFNGIGTAIAWATPYVQDIAAWLGDHLPGAVAVVRGWIMDKLVPAFQAVAGWVIDHWPQISAVVSAVFEAIRSGISFFVETIVPGAVAGFQAVFGWLMDNKEFLIGAAVAIGAALVALFVGWAAGAAAAAAATIAAAAPFILIGAAIAGVVGGVIYAYNHFEIFRTVVDAVASFLTDTLWPGIQAVFGWLRDNVPPIIQGVIDVATWLWKNVLSPLVDFLRAAWSVQMAIWKVEIDIITTAIGFLIDAGMWLWHNVLEPFGSFLGSVFSVAMATGKVAFDVLSTAVGLVSTAVSWLWNNVLSPFVGFIGELVDIYLAGLKVGFDLIATAVGLVATGAGWLWHNILEPFVAFLGAGFNLGISTAEKVIGTVKDIFDKVGSAALWVKDEVLVPLVNFLKDGFDKGWAAAKTALGYVTAPLQKIVDFLNDIISKAKTAIEWVGKLDPTSWFDSGVSAGKVGGLDTLIPGVNRHSGGLVPGFAGQEVPVVLKAGERVLTQQQASGAGWNDQWDRNRASSGRKIEIHQVVNNTDVDVDGFWRMANFAMAGA